MTTARLVAYRPNGSRLGTLPAPLSWSASVPHNDIAGAASVTYARTALRGEILGRSLTDGLEVAVEVADGNAWTEIDGGRFLAVKRSGDRSDVSDTVTLTMPGYGWLLGKIRSLNEAALIPPGDETDTATVGKRPFLSATAGLIMGTLLGEYESRGGPVIERTWTTAEDSNGQPWAHVVTIHYEHGIQADVVLANLVSQGMVDVSWRGRELVLTNPDSTTRDLASSVILRDGIDVSEAPWEETIEELVQHMTLHVGSNAVISVTDSDPSAPSPWGRWEGFDSNESVTTQGTGLAMVQAELERAGRLRGQYLRDLLPTSPHAVGLDIRPGDWITAPTHMRSERVRVAGVLLRAEGDQVTPSLRLNDRLLDAELRRARRTRGIVGGSSAGSNIRPAPEGPDKRTPAQVQGLVVESHAYIDPDGAARGLILAAWAPVSTARPEDGGGALEVERYELAWRVNSMGAPWVIAASVSGTEAEVSGLEVGTDIQVRVRARGKYATAPGVWSDAVTLTVAHDTTPPPVPSLPVATSSMGVATWTWDGLTHLGTAMPLDFSHVDAQWEGVRDGVNIAGADTLGGAGFTSAPGLDRGTTARARLRAVDRSGNESDWTAWVSVSVASVLDDTGLDDALSGVGDRIDHLTDNVIPDLADQIALGGGAFTGATRPPTTADGAGKPLNAIWTQYDGNRIVGSWLWDGAAWTPREPALVHIDGGTFGDLEGLRIKAGTVLADRLAIGSQTNLIADPSLADDDMTAARLAASTEGVTFPEASANDAGMIGAARVIRFDESRTSAIVAHLPNAPDEAQQWGATVSVTPGSRIALSAYSRQSVSADRWRWTGRIERVDGTRAFVALTAFASQSATFTTRRSEWVVPEDVVKVNFAIQAEAGTGFIRVGMPTAMAKTPGVLIEDGAITGDKLFVDEAAVNKIAAGFGAFDSIEVGWLKGQYLDVDALNFKQATGLQVQSGLFETRPEAARGIKIDGRGTTNEMSAWNNSGLRTFRLNADTAELEIIGGSITGPLIRTSSGNTRVQIQDDLRVIQDGVTRLTFGINNTAPYVISLDGSGQMRSAYGADGRLIFYNTAGSQALRLHTATMNGFPLGFMEGPVFGGGNSAVTFGIGPGVGGSGGSQHVVSLATHGSGDQAWAQVDGQGGWWIGSNTRGDISMDNFTGEVRIWARSNLLSLYGLPETTLTGQPLTMIVSPTGRPSIYRNTSLTRFKIDQRPIEEALDPTLILDVQVKDWLDRHQVERWREAQFGGSDSTEDWDPERAPARIPGVVAEEIEGLGLGEFCSYDDNGELVGVQYDRLALLLIPVVRDLRDRLSTLEAK